MLFDLVLVQPLPCLGLKNREYGFGYLFFRTLLSYLPKSVAGTAPNADTTTWRGLARPLFEVPRGPLPPPPPLCMCPLLLCPTSDKVLEAPSLPPFPSVYQPALRLTCPRIRRRIRGSNSNKQDSRCLV